MKNVCARGLRLPSTEHILLHFVNFDAANAVRDMTVRYRPPSGWSVRAARFESADEASAVGMKQEAVAVQIRIPCLRIYGLLGMQLVRS